MQSSMNQLGSQLGVQLACLESELRAAETERGRAVSRLSAAVAMVEQGIKQRLETGRDLSAQAKVVAGVCDSLVELLEEMDQLALSSALARPDSITLSKKTESSDATAAVEAKQNVTELLSRARACLKNLKESAAQAAPKRGGSVYRYFTGEMDLTFFQEVDMFRYKEDYEKHKQRAFLPALTLSATCLWYAWGNEAPGWPLVETLQMVFLVLYYTSLISRETVLKVNGSKIKAWWAVHHNLTLDRKSVV